MPWTSLSGTWGPEHAPSTAKAYAAAVRSEKGWAASQEAWRADGRGRMELAVAYSLSEFLGL